MNTAVVIGRVHKYDADLRTMQNHNQTRFLSCLVADEKVYPSGKSFSQYFRVMMFGKGIEDLKPQLNAGTLVMVKGEISLDQPKDATKSAMLKIVGDIAPIGAAKPAPTAPPPTQEPSAPLSSSDEVPF